jgi:hypothetical protein
MADHLGYRVLLASFLSVRGHKGERVGTMVNALLRTLLLYSMVCLFSLGSVLMIKAPLRTLLFIGMICLFSLGSVPCYGQSSVEDASIVDIAWFVYFLLGRY